MLSSVRGGGRGLGVGTLVVGCFFGLGADVLVLVGDELASISGIGFRSVVFRESLGVVLGRLDVIISGTGVGISLAGRGNGRATPVGNHVWLHNGEGGGGGDGTGEVGIIVGAGEGKNNGIELDGGDGIVGKREISTGIFAGGKVGAEGA